MQLTIAILQIPENMNNNIFLPNEGRTPSLGLFPTLLQKSIMHLSGLSCVAGVVSGHQQDDTSIMLLVDFKPNSNLNSGIVPQVFGCFNNPGIALKYLYINKVKGFMKLKLTTAKTLLN